jgi:hypothetical protein
MVDQARNDSRRVRWPRRRRTMSGGVTGSVRNVDQDDAFDALTRAMASTHPRRGVLRLVGQGAAGAVLISLVGPDEAFAKPKGKLGGSCDSGQCSKSGDGPVPYCNDGKCVCDGFSGDHKPLVHIGAFVSITARPGATKAVGKPCVDNRHVCKGSGLTCVDGRYELHTPPLDQPGCTKLGESCTGVTTCCGTNVFCGFDGKCKEAKGSIRGTPCDSNSECRSNRCEGNAYARNQSEKRCL